MNTTGLKSSTFDEQYIRDAQGNLTQVIGSGASYDDSALASSVNANTSSIAANTTAIAGKQDALTVSTPLALNSNNQLSLNANYEPAFDVSDGTLTKFSTTPGFPEMAISQNVMNRILALEAAINPFFCAGQIDLNGGGSILKDSGTVSFTINVVQNGVVDVSFSSAAPSTNYIVLLGPMRECSFYRNIGGTSQTHSTTGIRLYCMDRNGGLHNTLIGFAIIT